MTEIQNTKKYICPHCEKEFGDRRSLWYHITKMKQCCKMRDLCQEEHKEYLRLKKLELEEISPELERLYQYIIYLGTKEQIDETEMQVKKFVESLIRKNKNLPKKFVEYFCINKDTRQVAPGDIRDFMKLITTKRNVPSSLKKTIAFEQDYFCNICDCKLPPSYHIDHIKPLYFGGTNMRNNLQALCVDCHSKKTTEDNTETFYLIEYIVRQI